MTDDHREPAGGQGSAFTGRDVHIASGSGSVQTAQAGLHASYTRLAYSAKVLAEKMNAAIGRDVIFAGKVRSMLEHMAFSRCEITQLFERYSVDCCQAIRGAMEDFVRRERQGGLDVDAILDKFVQACWGARIDVRYIQDIEDRFAPIRQDSQVLDASSRLVAIEHPGGPPQQPVADPERSCYLEAQLRATQESGKHLQQQLAEARAEVGLLSQEIEGLRRAHEHKDAECQRLQEQLRQGQIVQFEVADLRQQNREYMQDIQSLQTSEIRLKNEIELLRGQLRQALTSRTPAAAPGAQPQAVRVNLDDYGTSIPVRDFLNQLSSWDMKHSARIVRLLLQRTNEHQQLWEALWKGWGFVRNCDIHAANRANPRDNVEAMIELCHRALGPRNEVPFRAIFESEHMSEVLRQALCDVIGENIGKLNEALAEEKAKRAKERL